MSQTNGAAARNTLSVRPANSRKLLARKAAEQAPATHPAAEALEDSFPAAPVPDGAALANALHEVSPTDPAAAEPSPIAAPPEASGASAEDDTTTPATPAAPATAPTAAHSATPASEPEGAPPSPPAAAATPLPATAPAWSREDEAALQAMLARRKAAGPRRGKDVGGMLLRAGGIAPNPDTVVATIVALVANAGGAMLRADLLELMAGATFAHPKAKPGDKGWCQGYVAGAIRDGFLAVSAPAEGGVARKAVA